ncbi:hypothetical protein PFNF54_05660 [Plasmodium falciparum NF54]|uniref:Protein SOC3 n=1 Tax=Plasmodium falciparum (isolate NF54) TaxID=5843 RepID=W7JXQ0_PLAFO|nr:hypothetical protein PFNF54_05660 [Plasmodium falciparum NF54]
MKNQNTDKLTNLKDLVPFYKKDNEKLNENTEDIVYSKEKKLLYFYLNSLERTVASLKNNEKQLHNNIQKITSDNKNLKKSIEEKKMDIIKAKNKNEEILKYMNVNKEHSNILRIRREMINEYKTNKLNDSNIALMIEEKKKYKKLLIYYLLYNNYLKLSASNIFENASSIYATISKLREATGVTDIYDINQKFMDIENKKNLLQKEEELSQKRLEDAIQEYQALNNEILNTFSEDKNILKKKIQNEKEKISDDIYESYKLVFASERELEDINIKLDKIKKFLEKQNSYFHSINMEEKMEFHSNEDMLQYIKNLKGVVETLMKITQQNRENGNISRSYKSLEFLEIMNLYRNVDFHKNMCRVDDTQELENTIKMGTS